MNQTIFEAQLAAIFSNQVVAVMSSDDAFPVSAENTKGVRLPTEVIEALAIAERRLLTLKIFFMNPGDIYVIKVRNGLDILQTETGTEAVSATYRSGRMIWGDELILLPWVKNIDPRRINHPPAFDEEYLYLRSERQASGILPNEPICAVFSIRVPYSNVELIRTDENIDAAVSERMAQQIDDTLWHKGSITYTARKLPEVPETPSALSEDEIIDLHPQNLTPSREDDVFPPALPPSAAVEDVSSSEFVTVGTPPEKWDSLPKESITRVFDVVEQTEYDGLDSYVTDHPRMAYVTWKIYPDYCESYPKEYLENQAKTAGVQFICTNSSMATVDTSRPFLNINTKKAGPVLIDASAALGALQAKSEPVLVIGSTNEQLIGKVVVSRRTYLNLDRNADAWLGANHCQEQQLFFYMEAGQFTSTRKRGRGYDDQTAAAAPSLADAMAARVRNRRTGRK